MKVSVIVPNHGRNTKTLEDSISASITDKDVSIHVLIINRGLERSVQRNEGIAKADGMALLILDSDQSVSPGLIQECLDLLEIGYSSVFIPEIITTRGFFGYLRNWERQFYTSTPIDCVRFIRKDICPLFSEKISGPEDSAFDRMVPGIKATSTNVVYHEDNIGLIDFLKKKAYYSKSMKEFSAMYPNDKVLNFWWRCFGVFFENGKYKKVLARPDLFILVMCLIFVRGIIYLFNK